MSNAIRTCIACGASDLALLTRRGSLRVMLCAQCGLTTGHLQSESAVDNEAAVATDPNHFWMVVEQYESLRIANSNLLINRLPRLEAVLGKRAINWLEIGPGSGTFGALGG